MLEQSLKVSIPEHLHNLSCSVTEALLSSTSVGTAARDEWVEERKLRSLGKGLTAGRRVGGLTTKLKADELKKYIQRHHSDLLKPGSFSGIATKILWRETSKPGNGWSDSAWLNGADGAVRPHAPSHSSLRRIISEIVSGKG